MDCSYFARRINNYIDGELGYVEVAELQQHLSFCESCAAEITRLSEVRTALAKWGQLELAPPPGFAERVIVAVEHDREASASQSLGEKVDGVLQGLDDVLGRLPLPGGRTIRARTAIGWGLAAAATVLIGLERRRLRNERELKTS